MFGYIKPFKPELKVREFDTFQAVYCGLCRQLRHLFGPLASLTLSYDFTLVGLLSLALTEEPVPSARCRCVANPLKRKVCVKQCDSLTLAACAAILMGYYKIKDDLVDNGFFGKCRSVLLLLFFAPARKKAARLYPELDLLWKDAMAAQAKLEADAADSPDRAADPTATALAGLCAMLSEDETQKQVLHRFGYLLGRYVYFADALDDLADDRRHRRYNPFLAKFPDADPEEITQYALSVIRLTMGELPPALALLDLKRYQPILENILFLGLPQEVSKLSTKEKKHEESL